MAYLSYKKLRESDFDGIVSKRDKLQNHMNISYMKFEVYDTYKKDEIITANVDPVNDEDVVNKGYPDEKILKIEGNIYCFEKDYNAFKL